MTRDEAIEALLPIAELLVTQDNAITDLPMFVVQQKRRDYGYDPAYSENVVWLHIEGVEADEDETKRLDEKYDESGDEPEDWTRTSYVDRWEFVTACLTRAGCERYIKANGHNLNEARIYVESGYRNAEWATLRKALVALLPPKAPEPAEPMFYIQNTSNYAYDYVLWWAENRNGYVYDLKRAGLYTQAEAESIMRCRPGEDVAWPAEAVRQFEQTAVPMPALRRWKMEQDGGDGEG